MNALSSSVTQLSQRTLSHFLAGGEGKRSARRKEEWGVRPGGSEMEGLRERGAKVSALFRRRTSEVGRSRQHANAPRPRRKAALHVGEIYGFVVAIATSVFAGELALADSDPASRSSHRSTDKVRPSVALTPTSRLLFVGLHPRRRPGRSRNPLLPLEVSAAEDGRIPRLSFSIA